jgi:hypothetical protein
MREKYFLRPDYKSDLNIKPANAAYTIRALQGAIQNPLAKIPPTQLIQPVGAG